MNVLGIETSCDETAAAVVEDGRVLRSSVVASQAALHQRFGGVVPEIASRRHAELILPVVDEALERAGVRLADVGLVAVTQGPGLIGALLVGVAAAKALAYAAGLPLVGVHHLEGHIYAAFLADPAARPPAVCLVVSGGHTALYHLPAEGVYRLLGATRDDAAGEALDKVGRLLGLPYPAGPALDRLARAGDPAAIPFPRAMLDDTSLDMSFSGLKTAALRILGQQPQPDRADFAASFQEAVVDVLVTKALRATEACGVETLLVSGGVAANSRLRERLRAEAAARGIATFFPPPELCTDNGAMIAAAGYHRYRRGERAPLGLDAFPQGALVDLPGAGRALTGPAT